MELDQARLDQQAGRYNSRTASTGVGHGWKNDELVALQCVFTIALNRPSSQDLQQAEYVIQFGPNLRSWFCSMLPAAKVW